MPAGPWLIGRSPSPQAIAVAAWATATVAWVVWRGVPLERTQVLVICLGGLLAASTGAETGAERGARRVLRDWVPIGIALAAFDLLRGLADELGRPVQVSLPFRLDEALFGGVPSVWLQRQIPPDATWWQVVASLLYASHFIIPFAVAAIVWWRSPVAWLRWRRRFLTVTAVALVIFLAMPVAPPWVASRVGEIGAVRRSAADGWSALGIDIAADVISYGQATTNLYAALPSLHTAYALLTAITIVPLLSRPAGLVTMAYPAALALTLVATGEHYVVDVVAGALLVVGVELYWRRQEPPPVAVRLGGERLARRRPWLWPVLAPLVLAAVIRVVRLDRPRVLVYDEVFYVNDALDLALTGGQPGAFHPPFAKLLIAPFVGVGGFEPVMWRLPMLLCGVAVVGGVGVATWLATADRRVTALAGLLSAVDGLLVVTSRIALLDGVVALCVTGTVVGLVGMLGPGGWSETGRRRWAPVLVLVSAGVGVATKWSVIPAAVMGVSLLMVAVHRRLGWGWTRSVATLAGAFILLTTAAWGPVVLRTGDVPVAGAVARMVDDSLEMARYHVDLERVGGGHASASTWVVQNRSSVMYRRDCAGQQDLTDGVCRSGSVAEARIVAAGNPALWIAGAASLIALAITGRRDPMRRALVAVAAASWLPWTLPGVEPYSYYGAAIAPVLAVTTAVALAGRRQRVWASVAIGTLAGAWLAWRYPDLTALT